MNISTFLGKGEKPSFSFEVLPPQKGKGFDALRSTIERLMPYKPNYINITNHHSEHVYTALPDGTFRRDTVRRRPGTIAVAAAIRETFKIPVVPHILCKGFSKEDIEYMLLDLQFLGIENLLLLRGDKARDEKSFQPTVNGYAHTTELQLQVNAFNEGTFLDGTPIENPGHFFYGVACYPEKHEESPNPAEDLRCFKKKVAQGAAYGVTQLFYNNNAYFNFVERCHNEGITVPVVAGIKPFTSLKQLSLVPKTFHCDLPEALVKEARKCHSDDDAKQLGIEWGIAQCRELIAAGVPGLHFYTMGKGDSVEAIVKQIF